MKIYIILFFLAMVSKTGIETPDFNIIKKFKDFELRDYGSIIIATTTMETDFSQSNSIGFQRVASYIFGGNDKNMKIEMTAPVMTSFNSLNKNKQQISFVMPKKHNLNTLPLSKRKDVTIKEKELGVVAVISFGGWATEEKANKYIKKLKILMENENLKTSNEIIIAQYNSPWIIPPFRKNEILIPLYKNIK
tara:strand:- start:3944 stop:4519 length:576 start_codon:yes stop_codon:yes gene_type:complete